MPGGNSPVSNLPYVLLTDVPDANALAQPLATALDRLVIPKYPSTTARDAANPTPVEGDQCYVTGSGWYEYGTAWVGPFNRNSGWKTWTPTWSTSSGSHLPSAGNAVWSCFYMREGKKVNIDFTVVFGSTTNFGSSVTGTDNWTFTLPVTPVTSSNGAMYFHAGPTSATCVPCVGAIDSSGLLQMTVSGCRVDGGTTAVGNLDSITPASGLWTNGSVIHGGGFYRVP